MVYAGTEYSIVQKSTWPVALSPMQIDSWVSSPMTQQVATAQHNFISDDDWIQGVLFLNDATTGSEYQSANGPIIGFGSTIWGVDAVYTPTLGPGGTPVVLTVYTPDRTSFTVDNVINDYNGNPFLVSDFFNGRYKLESFLNQTNTTIDFRLFDLNSASPVPVWQSAILTVNTLPKAVSSSLTGFPGTGGGTPYTSTGGKFSSLYSALQSTVQTGPNAGQTIPAQPLVTMGPNPSYTDPLTDNTYQYAITTGEVGNLTETVTILPTSIPNTVIQIDAVPTSSS